MKQPLLRAIYKSECERCHKEDGWLFIPMSKYYGLICNDCMDEGKFELDFEATRKNLGKAIK